MSWLIKPGQSLFDSVKDRFKPEDLAPLDDPALSAEQKVSHRLDLEWKYGLLAAQRAEEAIEIYHRARANAQSTKKVVDRIWKQHKHALEEVEEARRALQKAKLQAERLDTIAAEESRAHKSAWDGYQKAKARANESFEEYSQKAIQQGLDEAVGRAEREKAFKQAFKRNEAAPGPSASTPETQRQNASDTSASRRPLPSGPIPGYSSNPRARVYDPTRPPGYSSVGSPLPMTRPQQAPGGNNPDAHSDRVARDDAPTEQAPSSGDEKHSDEQPIFARREPAAMKQKRKQIVSSDESELTEPSEDDTIFVKRKKSRPTDTNATSTAGQGEQTSSQRVCKDSAVKDEATD